MKIIKLFLILLLLGALIQTSSLVNARDDLTLLQETDDDEDETETDDDDETESEDETDDEDDEEEKAEKESAYERELEITQEDYKFEIESELKFGENKDQIEIEFKIEDEAEIDFEYKTEVGSTESELSYEVEFQEIVEYVDIGVVGNGYQDGEEVSEYDIEDVDWNPISYTTEIVNGANVNVIRAETSDGVFVLVMKIAEALLDLENGVTLTPNSLKIDVEIHNFPYNNTGSSLALKSKLKSETEFKVEGDSTEETTGFAFDESQVSIGLGFFSWAETALADGDVVSVVSSTLEATTEEEQDDDKLETEVEQKIFFSFNTTDAQDIVWDPKVGVISEGTVQQIAAIESKYAAGDSSSAPGFGFWMILVSLGVVQALRFRKPKAN